MKTNSATLQKILDSAVESGEETGLQLVIYEHGEKIVDLTAGDGIFHDSLFTIFSVGKPIAATGIHMLVERGLLDYNTRIGEIWPEFNCNGKEDIRLWHLLSHRAGLQKLPDYGTTSNFTDWDYMCSKMAEATPQIQPGTRSAYHAVTYAWLVGETANRALGGGKNAFHDFLVENLFRPLKIERSFFFGTDDEAEKRVVLPDSVRNPDSVLDTVFEEVVRRGFIPSMNACASADAIARHYASLSPEGLEGFRPLNTETIEHATCLCRDLNIDPLPPSGTWAKFGLGYALTGDSENFGRRFGQGGALGSEGFYDKKNDISVGFTKNHKTLTHPVHPVRDRISNALGLPVRHW